MPAIAQLWLPILLSAVAVFIVSSLIHMVFKWHAADYRPLANEDDVRAAIRAGNPTPGHFVLPHCGSMQEMGSDAMRRKYAEGPVGYLTLRPRGFRPEPGSRVTSGRGVSAKIRTAFGILIAAPPRHTHGSPSSRCLLSRPAPRCLRSPAASCCAS
jgi:hypothetical protein